jgi:hypothetical protein
MGINFSAMGRTVRSLLGGSLTWVTLTLVVLFGGAGVARARPVLEGDGERLSRGETVVFDQVLDQSGHRYVGGTTYTIIDASMPELENLFVDMSAYRQLLPRTKEARLVGVDEGDLFIELRQGNSLLETSYTIRVRREGLGAGAVYRFWLDRTKPHGIEDAWGYFRLEPLAEGPGGAARVLLTYGVLVDVGPGLVRDLFEERLRQLALTVPQLVRQYAIVHFRSGSRVSLNTIRYRDVRNVE